MELRLLTNKERVEVRLGKTVLASLVIDQFCNDKDETVEEAILRACCALQSQLEQSVSYDNIDEIVDAAIPYISDALRPRKRNTSGYRKLSSPYMQH